MSEREDVRQRLGSDRRPESHRSHEPEATPPEEFVASDDDRLESLILAFDEALSGDAPRNPEDLQSLSPPSAAKLREMQKALRLLEQARLEGLLGDTPTAVPFETPRLDVSASARPSIAGQIVGHFELLSELGRGGYGVVFLAIDTEIGRQVALKIPRPEVLNNPETRRRFLREARAAGSLEHPNLIPVYEVGEDGPFCFLATAYCPGSTLAQWLKEANEPPAPALAARLVRDLARGVDHAHSRNVLHRDIKPSNVLIETANGASEQAVPRLTDFGLAKLTELSEDETRSGSLLGTPAYMAPEQAEGRLGDVGPGTDIYALGLLLYEILAGRPPFRGQTDVHTLRLVSAGEVPPLGGFRAGISRDLEAIVLRCLERDPKRRYASAGALADDLDRFLAGELTDARPATFVHVLVNKARKRPAAAAMIGLLCAAATLLTVGRWWYVRQLNVVRATAEQVDRERLQIRYVSDMNSAYGALASGHVQHAREQLIHWIPSSGKPDLRDFIWNHMWRRLNEQRETLEGHTGDIYCVRYSPMGGKLATASADGTVRIWDSNNGRCFRVLEGHTGEVNCVAFSPDDGSLASTSDDGTVRIWNVADGSTRRILPRREGAVWGVDYSPDGTMLAVCGADKRTLVWDVRTWELVTTLAEHTESVGAVKFSHDGRYLATACDGFWVLVWDIATWTPIHRLHHPGAVTSLSFDPQDRRLIAGVRSGSQSNIWDLESGKLLTVGSKHHEIVHDVAFHPQENSFGVVTKDGVVELHDADSGNLMRSFHGHAVRVWSLAFSPNGKRLATASADRTVKIWTLDRANPWPIAQSNTGARCLSLTRDGKRLATGEEDGSLTIHDLSKRDIVWHRKGDAEGVDGDAARDPARVSPEGTAIEAVAMAPAGDRVAASFHSGSRVLVWDVECRERIAEVSIDSSFVTQIMFSPDGGTLSVAHEDGTITEFETKLWNVLRKFRAHGARLNDIAYSHDGNLLASGGDEGEVKLWDRQRRLVRQVVEPTRSVIWGVAFSADDRHLAACGRALTATVWEVDSGRQTRTLAGHKSDINQIAFSPDGRSLATASDDGTLRLWDLATGQQICTLLQQAEPVHGVAFSPDGKALISTSLLHSPSAVLVWSAIAPPAAVASPAD
jgi:eukaryotic-like serine/threonine-protein kinase